MPFVEDGISVTVFDPVTPFIRVPVEDTIIDTWHNDVLINKNLRKKLPQIEEGPNLALPISGGMSIYVPSVIIGLQIGSIKIPEITALVVDEGHELLLGSYILNEIFKAGGTKSGPRPNGRSNDEYHSNDFENDSTSDNTHGVVFSDSSKEDPETLSIELFPIEYPYPLHHLEIVIRNQRKLHNIALIALGNINAGYLSEDQIDAIINNDTGIPDQLMLKVSAIDRGSIWISLKSGSQDALKYLALFFERSASAKLSQEVSEALKSKTEAQISEETRKAVSEAKISEQEKLKLENIHQTYQSLRKEWKERIEFTNQLIEEVDDPELAEKLKKRKDETIAELLEQKMVPIVRNIPGSYFTQQPTSSIDGKTLSLPPPSSSES